MTSSSLVKHRVKTFSTFLIIVGIVLVTTSFGPVLKDELWYYLKQLKEQEYKLQPNASRADSNDSVFARFLSTKPINIVPVNTNFSLVIEKIGINVPVVADVSVTDPSAYNESLKQGIAHASISKYPSEKPGNVYMFAHASSNFWTLGKYATVFNLLRKLDLKDRIYVFYNDKTYIYSVVNKEVFKGWNTYPITRAVIEPTLTLQTCDPPGTTLNRLVVTANLIDVK